MRANLRKMWELLEAREDHGAADMVDTMITALNDPAFSSREFWRIRSSWALALRCSIFDVK
jgi:hypothetical protein